MYNIAMHERSPSLLGICHVWLRNVRILGGHGVPNDSIPVGTVGDLEVQEIGTDGRIINANFHPGGVGHGFGSVIRPEWEHTAFVMDRPSVAEAKGEHFVVRNSSDFEQHMVYGAVAAHERAGGAPIPRIPEEGVRIAMQVNGVEVSARHFLGKLQAHFDQRNKERTAEVQKEAATLLKGRVRRLVDTLSNMEQELKSELVADFPEMAEAIFADE